MIPSGEKCAFCLHPFASHNTEGCAHNIQCPCLGFEIIEPEKHICSPYGLCCGSEGFLE